SCFSSCFFFNDTATTEIYTLSLHDALPISIPRPTRRSATRCSAWSRGSGGRSEEHTSELQSHLNLVCRLLFEKKTPQHSGGFVDTRQTQLAVRAPCSKQS